MKKNLKIFFLVAAMATLNLACEVDPDVPENLRDEYLGQWDVNETTGWDAPQFYPVNIKAGTADDVIIIEQLYNVSGTQVRAMVSGFNLNIPLQTSQGIEFKGDGQANSDFDQLSINFTANDGTGPDDIEAVLTPR
ncbi:MAG: hypothetical protein U5L96_20460 [Owenweeksia sp.]|nr:hypothetical protein [Owenweeksia sp.]